MSHSYISCRMHYVFSTKNRQPFITPELAARLWPYLGGIESYSSGGFSVSVSDVARTVRYIQQQAEHHRRMSFEQEFLAFLKKHDMDYDPQYVWD